MGMLLNTILLMENKISFWWIVLIRTKLIHLYIIFTPSFRFYYIYMMYEILDIK